MISTDSQGFLVENLNELNKEHSPSIPPGFPRERMPKELCKHSLTQMMFCLIGNQQNLCGHENKMYYMCKRERDAQIFSQIKDWELNEVLPSKGPQEKEQYIAELESRRRDLVKQFEKLPLSLGNKHKRWRIAADIEQLKWRLDYLGGV